MCILKTKFYIYEILIINGCFLILSLYLKWYDKWSSYTKLKFVKEIKLNGGAKMLDIVMIALLFIGFVSMKLLADWCGKQTEKK